MSKEAKIGLVVLISLVSGIWGLQYLKGVNIFSSQESFYSVYDNTGGLTVSSAVQYAGAKVGRVKAISLYHENSQEVDSAENNSDQKDSLIYKPKWLIEFTVDNKNLHITKNTIAKIEGNPLSASVINLILGDSTMAVPGDTLMGKTKNDLTETFTRELETLKKSIENLVGGVDGVVENVNAIFKDDATQGLPEVFSSLKRSIASLETTFQQVNNLLAENKEKFGNSMGNVEKITENFKNNTGKIDTILSNLSSVSDSISQIEFISITNRLNSTMAEVASITEKINNGDGTLGQLINSDSLVIEIEQTNRELQYLLNDISTNPKKYLGFSVIGRKDRNGFSNKEEDRIREIIKKEK